MIAGRVDELSRLTGGGVSWRIVISLLIALWSASAGTKALLSTLNVAYEEDEKRSFIRFNLVAITFTIGGIVGLMAALATIVVVPAVVGLLSLGFGTAILIRVVSFALLILFLIASLATSIASAPRGARPNGDGSRRDR